MTNPTEDPDNDDTPHAPEDGARIDEASGQKVGPPGENEPDPAKVAARDEEIEQAGGGH